MNVLKDHRRQDVESLARCDYSQREIHRRTGVDRKTIRRYVAGSKSPGVATSSEAGAGQNPPPRPPAPAATSACEPHRPWIESQVQLGRNAVSIYQDLVEQHAFTHRYNSVKRFVAQLRAREPERFDVLEYLPGEECQVDYGQGAPTLWKPGAYRRPYLFVMTLKYSGKSFRKAVWKTNQEIWCQLHEEAWRSFGGVPQYVVLDNLKEGVLHPDIYDPELNPLYAQMLQHYSVVADPCRVRDPNRKGTVENAVQHTQGTALKGRKYEAIEEQNAWLAHWEERWAAPRIHGRKKRQVLEMYHEEQPYLRPLPLEAFRYYTPGVRMVDDAGVVQVNGSYYAANPAPLHSRVQVRIYAHEIEIYDAGGRLLRRHRKSARKGQYVMDEEDRVFNPSRETVRLLEKAGKIGPHTAKMADSIFTHLGRPGQKALYGLTNLTRTYPRAEIEAVCGRLLAAECASFGAVRRALERLAEAQPAGAPLLIQEGPVIRAIDEYQTFWDAHSLTCQPKETADADDHG